MGGEPDGRAAAVAGYCGQCAELHGKAPTLSEKVRRWREDEPDRTSFGVVCTGCGATSVNRVGECVGHNHGVDLGRLREHAVTVHHRLRRLDREASADPGTAVAELADLMALAGHHAIHAALVDVGGPRAGEAPWRHVRTDDGSVWDYRVGASLVTLRDPSGVIHKALAYEVSETWDGEVAHPQVQAYVEGLASRG